MAHPPSIFTMLDATEADTKPEMTDFLAGLGLQGSIASLLVADPQRFSDRLAGPKTDGPAAVRRATHSSPRVGRTWRSGRTSLARGEGIAHFLPLVFDDPQRRVQQITLSPWVVDGHHIHRRTEVDENFYLYNWTGPLPPVPLNGLAARPESSRGMIGDEVGA